MDESDMIPLAVHSMIGAGVSYGESCRITDRDNEFLISNTEESRELTRQSKDRLGIGVLP